MKRLNLRVDLDTVAQNAREIRSRIAPGVRMLAVVKADAYGHGAKQVALRLQREKIADAFAVATSEEGMNLRLAGVSDLPIVVLGSSNREESEISVQYGLSQAVFDENGLSALRDAARKTGKTAIAHLKADSGMSRIGVRSESELLSILSAWKNAPEVRMEGMLTHFCAADEDEAFTKAQLETFLRMRNTVFSEGFRPILHAAASTAMLRKEYSLDMVRAGIALYGTGVKELNGIVRPAQTLVTHPVRLEWIEPGDTVGYSRRFRAARKTRVMTVPCGYGDGYPRILSGRADVLVNGRRAPIIGNVCMDMLMADVTDAGEITPESPVVLLGAQGGERITPDELAEKAQTIPYEIMLGFLGRVSREWIEQA